LFEYLNDGTNSQWVDVGSIPAARGISNGSSNVTITANANVSTYVSGNATAQLVVTATGVDVAGTLHVPGTSSTIAAVFTNVAETTTVSATSATGTIALYPSSQSVLYYTSAAAANWTTNITFSAGTTMNTAMTIGQAMTVTFMVTQGATAYYNNVVQVDGTTSGVTTKWQGGAPTAGNASGIDIYTYSVIKTGSATFTVLASISQFK
jgi:hypothetical protein